MRIDATRYKLFLTNPEEYRLREIWGHVPTSRSDAKSLQTLGRRRGTAFHELTDGAAVEDLGHLGDTAVATAVRMHTANEQYGNGTTVLWKEREFDIEIPGSVHRMVGRVDSLVERWEERFILDFKTTKHRTKEDMQRYRDELQQNPQVDFYLLAVPEVRKFVYRILWSQPKKTGPIVNISELTVTRAGYELKAFQRSVHMLCETIEFWKREFGTEKPWPRAVKLPISPELYTYAPIYGRNMYEGAEYEGFTQRVEHLNILKGSQ